MKEDECGRKFIKKENLDDQDCIFHFEEGIKDGYCGWSEVRQGPGDEGLATHLDVEGILESRSLHQCPAHVDIERLDLVLEGSVDLVVHGVVVAASFLSL